MIKKAVIAAAGNGTRFLPVTKAYPKELLPILNKPIIQLLIEELIGAGVEKVLIIHHRARPQIKNYFLPDSELEIFLEEVGKGHWLDQWRKTLQKINLLFLPQEKDLPYGTGSPILSAAKFINGDPFVYFFGDDLVLEKKPGQFLAELIRVFEKHKAAAVFGSQEVAWDEVVRYGSVRFKKGGKVPYQIETVEEGLPAGKAPSNFIQFGRFVVSAEVVEVLKEQPLSAKKELFFTDAMKKMAGKGVVIAQPIKKGKWLTTGDPERWLKTNLEFQKFFEKSS
jgi:UTP--glucose-1-phosphate uridylyltransferase